MKKLTKGSCVLEKVYISLNSLKEKDSKLQKDPSKQEYNCMIGLPKNSPDYVELISHIKEILAEKNLKIKQLNASKFPIKDGDRIYDEKYANTDKGEHLKGTYQIKFGTRFDFKVLDAYGRVLDKTQVAWMGAKVDIQFQPSFYEHSTGKGIKLNLIAIRVIEESKFETDAAEDAFDFAPAENDFEDVGGNVPNNSIDESEDELPF
jgi:hypothetical protein